MQERMSIEDLRALRERLAADHPELWPVSPGRRCWYRIDVEGLDVLELERTSDDRLDAQVHRSLIGKGLMPNAPLLSDCLSIRRSGAPGSRGKLARGSSAVKEREKRCAETSAVTEPVK
jgi:hypothetical protein